MRELEIVSGDIEEEAFRILDDYLFDVESGKRVRALQSHLNLVESLDNLGRVDRQITSGLNRAVEAYFPLR